MKTPLKQSRSRRPCTSIDLKRWLSGASLADAVIGTMIDHVLEKINGIADQINAEISVPRSKPGIKRR